MSRSVYERLVRKLSANRFIEAMAQEIFQEALFDDLDSDMDYRTLRTMKRDMDH